MTEDFYYLLNGQHIKKLCEIQFEELRKKYELRQVELEILYYIGNSSALQIAREIVNNWNYSKSHVSKCIDHLCSRGYLKTITDSNDHRRVILQVTKEGREVIAQVSREKGKIAEILYDGVTPEEQEVLKKVFHKIQDNIIKKLQNEK